MFRITKKAGSANVIWDVENDKPLLVFKGGLFETPEESVAKKAKALGYDVDGDIVEEKKPARGRKKAGE